MNKNILYIIISMVMFSFSACQKKTEAPKPHPGKPDSKALRVGIVPIDVCKPFQDAYNQGKLDSMHADIALKEYNAFSECRYALTHDLVDCAIIDYSLMCTINNGLPKNKQLRAIHVKVNEPYFHLLTAKKARIKHISQLTNKVIAVDSHGATHDIAFAATDSIRHRGQYVFLVQCEDLNVRTQMLNTGNVDAAILPEPFASKALKTGCSEIKLPKRKQLTIVLAVRPKVKRDQIDELKETIKIF